MTKIHLLYLRFERQIYSGVAAQVLFAIFIAAMPFSGVSAVQLTQRSIVMSDSGFSGGSITSGVGSGTNVAYTLNFTPSTATIGGIVVDFCLNSPLVGDSCTATGAMSSFNVNRSTTSVSNQTNLGAGAFTVYTSDATNNRIILTRATAAAPSGAAASIQLGNGTTNGFTNPNANGSFYARIYTYPTAASAQAHNTATPTGYVDYGGVALSIASVVQVTARVQETITFCVFGAAAPNDNCVAAGGSTAPALSIGHGTAKVIDSSTVDTGVAYMQISTNAGYGCDIRMHSSSTVGGLDGPNSNYIPAVGGGSATPSAITAGTAAFGLRVTDPGSQSANVAGTVTSDAAYYNAGQPTYYGMDTTTGAENVKTTFGDTIASATAPVSNFGKVLTFGATASNVTPAGLYSANLALIATGKF